jgi:ABC-2 type transport system permease protein
MGRIWVVVRQEYLMKVRTKAFLFGTFVVPVLFAAMAVLPAYFMNKSVDQPGTYAVVDETGLLMGPLTRALDDSSKTGERLFTLVPEPANGRSREDLKRELGARVFARQLAGFFLVPADAVEGGEVAFGATSVSDFQRNQSIHASLNEAVREVRISRTKLDPAELKAVLKPIPLSTFKVGEKGEVKKDSGTTFFVAYAFGICLYMILLIYGGMMLRAALEEKTSRSSEVMVATIRASTLMGGKIIGIGLVGLTQVSIWALLIALFSSSSALIMPAGSQEVLAEIGITPVMGIFFVVYFLLGFFFYASLYGAMGAMVSSETEAQQAQMPLMIPLVVALMFMFMALRDPNAPLVRIISLIPFFSPIMMTVRICVVTPPWWEIGLSVVLLLASIYGAMWIAGRIFRVGLLMYGKRPTLPELVKWVRFG